MTFTDTRPGVVAEDDLLLLTEPSSKDGRARRELPPGAEAMARPWRLGIVGIGITLGLVARLLAANGYFSVNSATLVYTAALTSLLAGIGLIAVAAERDRFDRWMVLLAAGTGVSLGALQWVSPHFASGTLEWSNTDQVALSVLGTGNGVLLAGILTLAFVRRWPTMTVVGVLAAGLLTLAANSVLLRNEWPAIAALALAFGGVLLAWDQAPRHEPRYPEQTRSPRISRAALSLAMLALAGSVLQLWISRGETVRRVAPAGVLSVALILLSFLAMIRIRRELQRRETSMNEWTSWMREIRTGDLRNDFETMGTTASGGLIGDVTGEVPRALSFPDLRVEDANDAPAPPAAAEVSAAPATPETPTVAPKIDIPAPPEPAPADEPKPAPVLEVPAAAAAPVQPRLFGDEPFSTAELPAAGALVWADDLEDAASDSPIIGDDQPALFDFERDIAPVDDTPATAEVSRPAAPAIPLPPELTAPVAAPEPTSTFSMHVTGEHDLTPLVEAAPVGAPQPGAPQPGAPAAPVSGAFTSWLDESPVPPATGSIEHLATWLGTTASTNPDRLVAAVETMSLADFDELPTEVSGAAINAMLERLAGLAPSPSIVASVDGPYLMVAWDAAQPERLTEVNRKILDAMATPVPTEFGAVGLTGTLALLRPAAEATIEDLIDQAIQGLVQARQLEAIAAEARSAATPVSP